MRAAVKLIDRLLRINGGLFEFSQEPGVILRVQLRRQKYPVTIGNQTISKGDLVIAIHLWNERVPKIPEAGADLKWALNLRRSLISSFKGVAKLIMEDPRCLDARAVAGVSALFSSTEHIGGMQMIQRMGFTVLPYHRPLGRFGEFWENLFSWWLMWTYNTNSLNSRKFWRLKRTEIWMTREEFLTRYG